MGWNRPVASIMEELRVGLDDLNKTRARKVLTTVYMLSPVKSGRYKANHVVSIGSPSVYYDARRKVYEKWFVHGLAAIKQAPRGSKIFIQQNLPYAPLIENGSSSQAPTGVYRIAAMQVK